MENVRHRGSDARAYFARAGVSVGAYALFSMLLLWKVAAFALVVAACFAVAGTRAVLAPMPPMERKRMKVTLAFSATVLLIPIAFAFASREVETNQGEARFVHRRFTSIQPVAGGVEFVSGKLFLAGFEPGKPRVIPLGGSFSHSDHHFQSTYTILGQSKGGIWVDYWYEGYPPATPGLWGGITFVHWK